MQNMDANHRLLNNKLEAEYLEYIAVNDVKDAFLFMIEQDSKLKEYQGLAYKKGMVRSYRYTNGDWHPFSFIVNKKWLLFYFRYPQRTHPNMTVDDFESQFESASMNKYGEVTIKIYNRQQAKLVMTFAFGVSYDEDPLYSGTESILSGEYLEGTVTQVLVNSYERNAKARLACIDHFGYKCSVCGFDFEKRYGELGRCFIQVHHLVEISTIKKEYIIDPVNDMRPVCCNCHAMIHRTIPAITIEVLKSKLTLPSNEHMR